MKGVLSKNLLLSFFAFFMAGIGSPLARAEMAQQLEDYVVINRIELLGKNYKGFILIRELPFSIGDTIAKRYLLNNCLAEENLNNLLLFNYMRLHTLQYRPLFHYPCYRSRRRWYIWPLVELNWKSAI